MNENEFATGSVPVMVAARIYGKDASWVRAGIISGWLPIGKATRNGQLVTKIEDMNSKYGRINFYISPKRLYEETGYVWKGEKQYTRVRTRNNYNSLYERRVTTMSNLKNVIIYLLSVLIAFESGVLLFIVGMFTVTNDLKNDRKNRSVSYRSYRKGD